MSDVPVEAGVTRTDLEDGRLWAVTLDTPPANILDAAKIEALTGVFQEAREAKSLKAILLRATGPHFSFGASVEEHLPGACEAMIPAFHRRRPPGAVAAPGAPE